MKLVKDIFLATVILAIMAGGFLGQRLPFRYPLQPVGQYQLAAFNSGLALSQLNRTTPFYRLSPLNDFVTDESGTRSAHLDVADLGEDKYEAYLPGNKIDLLWLAIKTYRGVAFPAIVFDKPSLGLRYDTQFEGDMVMVTKTLTFSQPTYVGENGMTLSFNAGDTVSVNNEGVTLVNSEVPGVLTVKPGPNQGIRLNDEAQLIEVTEKVNKKVNDLTMTIYLTGAK